MATKGRTKTKSTKQVCYGKKSGCIYKGKPWDSHPDNPLNSPKRAGKSLGKEGLVSHAKKLKKAGYTKEATKMMRQSMKMPK